MKCTAQRKKGLTDERHWLSGCVAIVHVLQIYSCLVHSDVVKESTFYTDHEVFEAICVKNLVSVVFLQLLHSQAQSMWFGFYQTELVRTGRGYKTTESVCFVVQVVQSVEKPGGTVVGFSEVKKEK